MLSDVQLAVAAAAAGALVVRARYGAELARIEKSSTDFATEVDLEPERVIKARLRAERPADAFVGEESGRDGPASAGRTWLVDPLCGTLNYAARTPLAAVNVGLMSEGRVVVAASADPFAGEVFWTDGDQAFVRRHGHDDPLRPTARCRLVDLNLDPPYPNGERFMAVRLLSVAEFTSSFRPRVLSTTLALAWVAAGRRGGYVSDGRVQDSVHFASGMALCRAAGCRVTGLRGQPLELGPSGLVVAADDETHATLLAIIAERCWRRE
ncbi:MAG TPA: inositol monophosphatase family protein [Jatrophihabitantaceae bacterium]|nr:inositol monophosphatase family protein [Jatrophihabitantaceae bacterium]